MRVSSLLNLTDSISRLVSKGRFSLLVCPFVGPLRVEVIERHLLQIRFASMIVYYILDMLNGEVSAQNHPRIEVIQHCQIANVIDDLAVFPSGLFELSMGAAEHRQAGFQLGDERL